jgi:SAM-dependent methyltransferase
MPLRYDPPADSVCIHSYGIADPAYRVHVADPIFEAPRLAEVYDPLDPDRSDLDAYVAMVDEFGARSVLDIGCGTGTLACLLARRGLSVTAVDPAGASLAVAGTKPGADRVRWVHGDATDLAPLQVDLVTMTANVAQVFLTDGEWALTLQAAYAALRPGGRLVFETRDPAAKAWLEWTRERSYKRIVVPGVGGVRSWVEVLDVGGDLVSFRGTVVFESDGAVLTSDSTLRFRHRDEVAASLAAAGFVVDEVREAPDRPGREMVFIARRAPRPPPSAGTRRPPRHLVPAPAKPATPTHRGPPAPGRSPSAVGSSAVPGPVGRGLLGLASGGGATFSPEVVDQAGLGSQPGPLLKDSGSLPGAGAWAGCGDPAEETGAPGPAGGAVHRRGRAAGHRDLRP